MAALRCSLCDRPLPCECPRWHFAEGGAAARARELAAPFSPLLRVLAAHNREVVAETIVLEKARRRERAAAWRGKA